MIRLHYLCVTGKTISQISQIIKYEPSTYSLFPVSEFFHSHSQFHFSYFFLLRHSKSRLALRPRSRKNSTMPCSMHLAPSRPKSTSRYVCLHSPRLVLPQCLFWIFYFSYRAHSSWCFLHLCMRISDHARSHFRGNATHIRTLSICGTSCLKMPLYSLMKKKWRSTSWESSPCPSSVRPLLCPGVFLFRVYHYLLHTWVPHVGFLSLSIWLSLTFHMYLRGTRHQRKDFILFYFICIICVSVIERMVCVVWWWCMSGIV